MCVASKFPRPRTFGNNLVFENVFRVGRQRSFVLITGNRWCLRGYVRLGWRVSRVLHQTQRTPFRVRCHFAPGSGWSPGTMPEYWIRRFISRPDTRRENTKQVPVLRCMYSFVVVSKRWFLIFRMFLPMPNFYCLGPSSCHSPPYPFSSFCSTSFMLVKSKSLKKNYLLC